MKNTCENFSTKEIKEIHKETAENWKRYNARILKMGEQFGNVYFDKLNKNWHSNHRCFVRQLKLFGAKTLVKISNRSEDFWLNFFNRKAVLNQREVETLKQTIKEKLKIII